MRFLLDTNVISEPRKRQSSPAVVEWLATTSPKEKLLSVMTLGELRKGAARARTRDDIFARQLEQWITEVTDEFHDRIVAVDGLVADAWGTLVAVEPRPIVDSLIGATALVHGFTVATRNTRDFARMGVPTYNPFEDAG
jgi:hypothetical protein